jgi:lupus La protein
VDEEKVGTAEGQWPFGKVLRFTVSKKDGSTSGEKEGGERFEYGFFKRRLAPIVNPAFVSLEGGDRKIAGLPSGDKEMKPVEEKKEFPTRLTAPPTIAVASEVKAEEPAAATAPSVSESEQSYPAKGQSSFKEVVTDEALEKLRSEVGEVGDRKIEWVRASGSSFLPLPLLSPPR